MQFKSSGFNPDRPENVNDHDKHCRSAEMPVDGSIIADVVFRSREILNDLGAKYDRKTATFHVEVTDTESCPLIVLKNENKAELHFRVDSAAKLLVGDWDDYVLTDQQVHVLTSLVKKNAV